jgi:two-component system chemotaxis sensor kinase CheA
MLKGKGEFVNLRGEQIPVVRLNEALGLSEDRPQIWDSTLVCVESEKGRMAILVDALLGRQQVVIKTLGRSMAKIKEISGGAILGNGDIALILNIDGLCSEAL